MSNIPQRSLETLFVNVLSRVIYAAGSIVMARVLGPAGKGILAYVVSVFALVVELAGGHTAAVAYQYGRRGMSMRVVYSAMMRVLAVVVVPLAAVIAAVALVAPGQRPLLAAAAALPLAAYVQSTRGYFLADSAVRFANVQGLVAPSLFAIGGSIALLVSHGSLTVLLAVFALSYVPAIVYTAAKLRTLQSQRTGEPVANPFVGQIVFGAQAGAVNLINFLNNRIDLFIIIFALGVRAAGVYSVAIAVGELVWYMSGPVSVAAYGSIGALDEPAAAKLTAKCIRNTLPIALLVSIGLYLTAPALVAFVFGRPFAEAGYVARYLLPGAIAWSAMYHINTFITIQVGRPQIVFWIAAASAVVCAATTLALIRPFGIAGGAIGSSVAYGAGAAWAVAVFLRRTKVNPLELIAFGREDLRRYVDLIGWAARSAGAAFAR